MKKVRRGYYVIVAIIFLVLSIGYHNYLGRPIGSSYYGQFPAKAADFILDNNLEGEIYNTYNHGGFLIWKLYPEYKVFIDGRYEMFDPDVAGDFNKVSTGNKGWEEALNKNNVDIAIIPPAEVHQDLANSDNWILVYFDNNASIFLRKGDRNEAVAEKYSYKLIKPFSLEFTYEKQDEEAVVGEYSRSLEDSPDIFVSLSRLGTIYINQGEYELAEKYLRKAVEVFPESVNSNFNLATALEKQGKNEESEKFKEKSQRLRN